MTSVSNRSRVTRKTAFAVAIIALVLFAVFPYYWMLVTALGGDGAYQSPPSLVPSTLDLSPFREVVARKPVDTWLRNSLLVAGTTVVVGSIISINAAYNLSRFRNRANRVVAFTVLGTQMIPAAVLVLPIFLIFLRLGLVNSLSGLVVANVIFALPLSVWMLKGFFDSAPAELEEAAMIDGCTRLGAFRRVILPVVRPGIAAVAVFLFMTGWAEFFFARTLVGTRDSAWVMTLGLASFQGEFGLDRGGLMAAITIYVVPPVTMFIVTRAALVKGLASGAAKG